MLLRLAQKNNSRLRHEIENQFERTMAGGNFTLKEKIEFVKIARSLGNASYKRKLEAIREKTGKTLHRISLYRFLRKENEILIQQPSTGRVRMQGEAQKNVRN